ncbi:hypothetical protein AB6A40_000999 [Gnathostoma spinigerum]|uniref:Uncharacterized protein n=1 Tax=Gnathostoma spinigerum TaxID=75299 RepID=A0ABD6E470_9BILA
MSKRPKYDDGDFRCYVTEEDELRWFVYWIRDENLFGVTDGMSEAFESVMKREERRQLLGDIADALLEDNWKEAFDCNSFSVKWLDTSRVQVEYFPKKVILEKTEGVAHERIANVLYFAVEAMNRKLKSKATEKPVGLKRFASKQRSSPKKVYPKSEMRSVVDPTKRKKSKPTGLTWDDAEEDANNN